MKLSKKIALIAAGSLLSVGGLYAVSISANAATPAAPNAPAVASPVAGAEVQNAADTDNVQEGNQNDANEVGGTESANDGADDATESANEGVDGADDATEVPDTTEVAGN